MSSREPMWFCHECHAEMRPLMVPDPHCASCNGTFVEKLENSQDDPREFHHTHDMLGGLGEDPFGNEFEDFLSGLRTFMLRPESNRNRDTRNAPVSPSSPRSEGTSYGTDRSTTNPTRGHSIRIDRTGPEPMRTFILRSGSQGRADGVPPLSEFLSGTRDTGTQERPPLTGPLLAQYLLSMLASRQGGDDFANVLGGLFSPPEGAENGRWGDYVTNQEALDQIITQLMEQSNPNAPVPATEEVMQNLPREVLVEGSLLLERDCAICKDQFKLDTEDPDERLVVTLPCSHPFHEPCIIPWLKSSGTCPVCRYQLVPQPSSHPPGPGPAPQPSGSNANSGRPQSSANPSNQSGSQSGDTRGDTRRGTGFGGNNPLLNLLGNLLHGGDRNGVGNRRANDATTSSRSGRSSADSEDHIPGDWSNDLD
ncbi:hypothetical protein OBBRIDRAFT_888317 [Obba rivulosa]|uniref:RING-type domain-containing protein n=1 Tax=Obba rivulosa TaxID=1052685 RepID=A0A8E2AWE0_9APHY|nr:hypothetical protein OBBRIDRAFT_888317 [Obba rivulosa]